MINHRHTRFAHTTEFFYDEASARLRLIKLFEIKGHQAKHSHCGMTENMRVTVTLCLLYSSVFFRWNMSVSYSHFLLSKRISVGPQYLADVIVSQSFFELLTILHHTLQYTSTSSSSQRQLMVNEFARRLIKLGDAHSSQKEGDTRRETSRGVSQEGDTRRETSRGVSQEGDTRRETSEGVSQEGDTRRETSREVSQEGDIRRETPGGRHQEGYLRKGHQEGDIRRGISGGGIRRSTSKGAHQERHIRRGTSGEGTSGEGTSGGAHQGVT